MHLLHRHYGDLTMQSTTLKNVKPLIKRCFNANIVPFLHSSPALGKSSLVKQIAQESNCEVIDLRLTELDSSDLNGLPYFKDGKSTFLPFDTFPLADTPLPKDKQGWLLLLDEFNSALPSVQASAYKLILDRQVGQHKLHDKVAIIACGNLDTDNAIVNPMSTALISRFAHFYIHLSVDDWREWAISKGLDSRITAFIGFRPSTLYTFKSEAIEPYASPRTWQMVSNLIKDTPVTSDDITLLSSLLGDGVASEFISFVKVFGKLPDIKQIQTNPDNINVPDELSVQWATLTALACHKDTLKHMDNVQVYMKKFPVELQLVFLRELKAIHPTKFMQATKQWQLELSTYINKD